MGSSAKKKREKKKDFQKPKLKVGKARPKPTNQTDTNFRSKAIVLSQQSLTIDAPSTHSQFTHHLSLITSKSDSQRRDSLGYLTSYKTSRPSTQSLPVPLPTLLAKLNPLILDGSSSVRTQLLKLFRSLPPTEVRDHAPSTLPYIRAGMTHLASDIRSSSIDTLSWLIEVAGDEIVSCAGGWQKTLECFLTQLGWPFSKRNKNTTASSAPSKWTNASTAGGNKITLGRFAADTKFTAKTLVCLAVFLRAGIDPGFSLQDASPDGAIADDATLFPLWHVQHHVVPRQSNAYGYLNLFGVAKEDDNQMLDDYEDRRRMFDETYRDAITSGLEAARREGGEQGRAAAAVVKVLKEAPVMGE